MNWLRISFVLFVLSYWFFAPEHSDVVYAIWPAVAALAAAAGTAYGIGKDVLKGGGNRLNKNQILKDIRERTGRIGGATRLRNEAILKQQTAGGSRVQAQNVLGQQLNRDLGTQFDALNEAELSALQMIFQAQREQDYIKAQTERDTLNRLGSLASSLAMLKEGGIQLGKEGGQISTDDFLALLNPLQKAKPNLDYQKQQPGLIPVKEPKSIPSWWFK